MATWRKRGNVYYADFYQHHKRVRKPIEATCDADADAIVAEIERSIQAGKRLHVANSPTLGKLLELFLAEKAAKRESATAELYAKHARHFKRHLPLGIRAAELAPEHVDAYLATRVAEISARAARAGKTVDKDTGKRTANKERVTLATIYNWGMRRRHVDRNPVMAVDPFAVRMVPPQACPAAVYEDLVAALKREAGEVARGDHRLVRLLLADVVQLIWHTGLRMGEACRLEPCDVDLEAATITVRSARNKGPAVIPLPAEVREILERRIDLGWPLVFCSPAGQPAYQNLYHAWSNWLATHPEHAPAHPHALRHAFQKRLEDAGIDETVIQKLMRHSTLRMHAHYSHRDLDVLRAALRRLRQRRG